MKALVLLSGGDESCHRCGTCIDREAPFAADGVTDPLAEKGA